MTTRFTARSEVRKKQREATIAILNARAEVARIVASGKCPRCAQPVVQDAREPALWKCAQSTVPAVRPDLPACTWQGFTG